jgi:hypothetical protein
MVSQNTHNRRAVANPPLRLIPEIYVRLSAAVFPAERSIGLAHPAHNRNELLRKTGARAPSNFSITKLLNSTILPDL